MNTTDRIGEAKNRLLREAVVVAVRLGSRAPVLDTCRAIARGGIRVIEVTLTTPGALDVIEALSRDADLLVGGGTVLTPDDARRVADAGGRFALSPVVDAAVIEEAHRLGLLAVPGTATPTEILTAHRSGADLVKVFPSGPLGGPDFLRKVRGPLPDIPLVPTSGPTAETIAGYFDAGAVAVGVGGEELFPRGFTPKTVEKAARRISDAVEKAHPRR